MKNIIKFVGIITVLMVIAISFITCDNGSTSSGGSSGGGKVTFTIINETSVDIVHIKVQNYDETINDFYSQKVLYDRDFEIKAGTIKELTVTGFSPVPGYSGMSGYLITYTFSDGFIMGPGGGFTYETIQETVRGSW